ncbi:hypothetical protein H1C71_001679 [Ictidomys tridecemlineatus]|nr:hypothetical protein H1C71_001679 [Ictidomys tridecemlineatus]
MPYSVLQPPSLAISLLNCCPHRGQPHLGPVSPMEGVAFSCPSSTQLGLEGQNPEVLVSREPSPYPWKSPEQALCQACPLLSRSWAGTRMHSHPGLTPAGTLPCLGTNSHV